MMVHSAGVTTGEFSVGVNSGRGNVSRAAVYPNSIQLSCVVPAILYLFIWGGEALTSFTLSVYSIVNACTVCFLYIQFYFPQKYALHKEHGRITNNF